MATCKHCGKSIPDKMNFCKYCGATVERVQKDNKVVEYELEGQQTLPSCPVVIETAKLLVNKVEKNVSCNVSVRNNSEKNIIAIFFTLCTFDISGDVIEDKISYPILDISLQPNQTIADSDLKLKETVRKIKFKIDKVVFVDSEVWRGKEDKWLQSYAPKQSIETYGKYKGIFLKEMAEADCFSGNPIVNATTYPQKWEDMWLCTCGKYISDAEICLHCGMSKKWLFQHGDMEYLQSELEKEEEKRQQLLMEQRKREKEEQERLEEQRRKQEEQKERENQESIEVAKRHKKQFIIITVIILILVAVIGLIIYGSNVYAMEKGRKSMYSGDYETAIEWLESANGVLSSEELLQECKYKLAEKYCSQGKYEDAENLFNEIESYSDSRLKILECQYLRAVSYDEAGKYDEALALLETIKDYKDTASKIKEVQYHKGVLLYKNKEYEAAIKQFEIIKDYEDANKMCQASYYKLANKRLKQKSYKDALEIYQDLGSYKKSKQKKKECIYQLAQNKYKQSRYKEAYKDFKSISSYKKAKDWMQKSYYMYGKECYNDELYAQATEIFEKLGNYKDAKTMACASDYARASNYYKKGKYELAKKLFAKLGSYSDSYSMLQKCEEMLMPEDEFATERYYYLVNIYDYDGNVYEPEEYGIASGQLFAYDGEGSFVYYTGSEYEENYIDFTYDSLGNTNTSFRMEKDGDYLYLYMDGEEILEFYEEKPSA